MAIFFFRNDLGVSYCWFCQALPLSHVMSKLTFCMCVNKGADQLRSNCAADQSLCFRCIDSTILFLHPKFQASYHFLWLFSLVCVSLVCVRPGRKLLTGFLLMRLLMSLILQSLTIVVSETVYIDSKEGDRTQIAVYLM